MSDDLRHWVFEVYLPQNVRVRDAQTRKNYRHAVDDFAEFLGREPWLADLTDELLSRFLLYLLDGGDRRNGPLAETGMLYLTDPAAGDPRGRA